MGVELVREAIDRIRACSDGVWFVGERSEDLVSSAEEALGFSLPDSYRLFVRELGAGNVGAEEVFGVTSADFADSAVPNGVWLTLNVREVWGLSPTMVVVYFDGGVDYYVMDCSFEDPPLVVWRPGETSMDDEPVIAAEDFGRFLLELTEREL